MLITSKGRVTIPAKIRKQAGLLPGMEVDFEFDGNAVSIVPVPSGKKGGRRAHDVGRLRTRGGNVTMSTEEIMALTRRE